MEAVKEMDTIPVPLTMEAAKKMDTLPVPITLEQAINEIEDLRKRMKRLEDEIIRIKQGRRWV